MPGLALSTGLGLAGKAPPVAPITPDQVASATLAFWYEADDEGAGSLRDAGAGTFTGTLSKAGAPDGDWFVSQWDDLSGNDEHLVQATTTLQPKLVRDARNGRNLLRFDGSNDLLRVAFGATLDQPNTTLLVGKWSVGGGTIFLDTNTGTTARQILFTNSSDPRVLRIGADTTLNISNALITDWCLMRAIFDGASSRGAVNEANQVQGNAGVKGLSGLTLGANTGGTGAALDVGALIGFAGIVGHAELAGLLATYRARYGV